jgi:hypothetical protein
MTVDEELELTAESTQLREVAESLHNLAADAEAAARLSSKHGAEFDYIASFIAKLAKECEEYEEEFAKGEA